MAASPSAVGGVVMTHLLTEAAAAGGGRPGWSSVHGSLCGGEEVRRYADDAPEGGVGAGGAAASPAELGNMARCSAPGAAAGGGVRVDQHSLVCAAICINQRNEGGQCEPRGDGDGDVGDTIGRPGEDFVLAPENTRNVAELAKMLSDGGVRQRGGGGGEANGGDGVARRPAVDEGAAASGPRDAGGEAVKIPLVLVGSEECQPEKL